MKRFYIVFILLSLVGCAFNQPQGPTFKPYTLKNNDKALIYVYRPLGEKFGYNRTYYLFDDKGKITDLKHGGYFPFEVDPGPVTLFSHVNATADIMINGILAYVLEKNLSKNSMLDFEAKEGETYFVRFKPITHAAHFEATIFMVSDDEGLKEIRECKLIVPDK